MFQYRLTTFNVLTNVVNVQRFTLLLIAISDDEYCLERDVTFAFNQISVFKLCLLNLHLSFKLQEVNKEL
jgi:hypothetical protein